MYVYIEYISIDKCLCMYTVSNIAQYRDCCALVYEAMQDSWHQQC